MVVLRPGAGTESWVFMSRLSLVTLHAGGTGWTLQPHNIIVRSNTTIEIALYTSKTITRRGGGSYVVPTAAFVLTASCSRLLLNKKLGYLDCHLYYLPDVLVTDQNLQFNIDEHNHRVYK